MRYHELTVANFRVFAGTQTMTFPDGEGVVIVYGRNGKGKTSFLNAIRWAWTGAARSRGSRAVTPDRLVNRDALAEADGAAVTCRVRLGFTAEGSRWDLTRSIVNEGGALSEDVTLVKDGVTLTASDTSKRLAELMPPEIEQFFLFDGELLDQYERLVDDEAPTGSPLRESIEKVLGVPVVVNAARDMRTLAEEAGKAIAEAAKRERSTRELGQALEQAQTMRSSYRANKDTESEHIATLQVEARQVEEALAEQQSKLDLLGRRDLMRESLKELQDRHQEAKTAFAAGLANAWRAVLVDPLTAAVDELEAELEQDRERLSTVTVAVALSTTFRGSGEQACPACASPLDEPHRHHLEQVLAPANGSSLVELNDHVHAAAARVKTLRRIVDEQARADLRALERAYRELDVQVADTKDDLEQLDDQLRDTPAEELNALAKRGSELAVRLEKAQEVFLEQTNSYNNMGGQIDKLRASIEAAGAGTADPATLAREKVTAALAALFDQAVVAYRDKLKEDVQETASKLFRNMRAEVDFAKLTINDQYGLRILDSKGNTVEDRSAGYEHLVALSLIGALQECSPITGPVVMDSPFGRLDPEHVEAVVGQLTVLAKQVFLLVHEGELDRATARKQLHGRLLAEYELKRVTANNTTITELRNT
ncbi:MAG: hypothetical protein JWM02_1321 [Frankiales bacterium]|nr:hypothetical protein [Frankiales bacterium]